MPVRQTDECVFVLAGRQEMSCYLCHYNTATSPTLPLPLSPKANSLTLDKHPWHGYLRGRGGGSRTADKKDTALLGPANSQLHSEEDVGRLCTTAHKSTPSILDWGDLITMATRNSQWCFGGRLFVQ